MHFPPPPRIIYRNRRLFIILVRENRETIPSHSLESLTTDVHIFIIYDLGPIWRWGEVQPAESRVDFMFGAFFSLSSSDCASRSRGPLFEAALRRDPQLMSVLEEKSSLATSSGMPVSSLLSTTSAGRPSWAGYPFGKHCLHAFP